MKKTTLLLIAQLTLIALICFMPLIDGTFISLRAPQNIREIIGLSMAALGNMGLIICFLKLSNSFTANVEPKEDGELRLLWPYTWSRNPMYVSGHFASFGWALLNASFLTGLLAIIQVFLLHTKIIMEENYLKPKYGAAYSAFKIKVRRYL